MKLAIASLLATSFIAGNAYACGFKSAEHKTMTTAKVEVTEEAVSTYDPAKKPIFEEMAQAAEKADEMPLEKAD